VSGPKKAKPAPVDAKRPRVSRRKGAEKPNIFVLVGAAVALLAVAGAMGAYVALPRQRAKATGTGKRITVVVPANESADGLALLLETTGVIQDAARFRLYERVRSVVPVAGEHLLRDDLTLGEIADRLTRSGGGDRQKVTVPEGFTRFDIGRRLEEKGICTRAAFVAATGDGALLKRLQLAPLTPEPSASAEGFLFPATYEFGEDEAPEVVVERLVGEFEKRWKKLEAAHGADLARLSQTLRFSRRDIVTLASVVEKEAAVDEERPLVASVFENRLRDPAFPRRVLQSDPTAGYGCAIAKEVNPEFAGNPTACGAFSGKITAPMNHDRANRYSTYTHEGLPPGPIANPGLPSIEAVLSPRETKFLYFVAKGGGRHTFSESLDAHNAAVHPD